MSTNEPSVAELIPGATKNGTRTPPLPDLCARARFVVRGQQVFDAFTCYKNPLVICFTVAEHPGKEVFRVLDSRGKPPRHLLDRRRFVLTEKLSSLLRATKQLNGTGRLLGGRGWRELHADQQVPSTMNQLLPHFKPSGLTLASCSSLDQSPKS